MGAEVIGLILLELVKFAAEHGQDIASIVSDFKSARPELCGPGQPCAPPERDDRDIDYRVDALVEHPAEPRPYVSEVPR